MGHPGASKTRKLWKFGVVSAIAVGAAVWAVVANRAGPNRTGVGALEVAQLTSDEKSVLERITDPRVQAFYAKCFAVSRSSKPTNAEIDAILLVAARSPLNAVDGVHHLEVLEHPYNAGHALAVLTRVWHIAGPIEYGADRLAAEARRLADADDEVVMIQAAMMLYVMREKAPAAGFSKESSDTLNQLLANEFVAHHVEIQKRVLAETARGGK